MSSLSQKDIYIIQLERDKYFVYSPLRGLLFSANEESINAINKYFSENDSTLPDNSALRHHILAIENTPRVIPEEKTLDARSHVVILLSHKCNLACSYCYAEEARSNDTLSFEKIKIVVDNLLGNGFRKAAFTFMGGGEPTYTWDLLVSCISYIRQYNYPQDLIKIGVTTNGTLLNQNRIDWLIHNNVEVGFSFEILPNIQDAQRCFSDKSISSHTIVDRNLRILISQGVFPRIRSTITQANLYLMSEMVEYTINHYPGLKHLHFEHVTAPGLTLDDYYLPFIDEFFKAKRIANESGIELRNSLTTSVSDCRTRFCRGEYCVTPTGMIVSCHRVADERDPLFGLFNYGEIKNSTIEFDEDKCRIVQAYAELKPEKCDLCFARWHCGGICTQNKYCFSETQKEAYCSFSRAMILRELEYQYYNPSIKGERK